MSKRVPISTNKLILSNKNGKIYEYSNISLLKNGMLGTSCICYIAYRETAPGFVYPVILKEFYPSNIKSYHIERNSDGSLNLESNFEKLDNLEVMNSARRFICEVELLKKFSMHEEIKGNLLVSPDIELLYGNGTVYYENIFNSAQISLEELQSDKETSPDEILIALTGIITFLDKLHESGYALIDLKPSDIMFATNEIGQYDLTKPLFFDLGSVLLLGEEYERKLVDSLSSKINRNRFKNENTIQVNLYTEYAMFGKILVSSIDRWKNTIDAEIYKRIINISNTCIWNKKSLSSFQIRNQIGDLEEIKNQLQNDIRKYNSEKLDKKIKGNIIVRSIIYVLSIISYFIIVSYMIMECVNGNDINDILGIDSFGAGLLLIGGFSIFVSVLKLLIVQKSEWIERTKTSIAFYDKKYMDGTNVRNGNYNTYKKGKRKNTTFIDDSDHNKKRQHYRRVLWVILGVTIIGGLFISLLVKSLPVFVIIGCISLIAFMYSELLPSSRDFFKNCVEVNESSNDYRMNRACYFKDEYKYSKEANENKIKAPFDVDTNWYRKENRNLYKFRERIIHDNIKNLKFTSLIIRNIYKQAFDRIRNRQLITHISSFVVLIIGIVMFYIGVSGYYEFYTRITPNYVTYGGILMTVISAVCSVYQMLVSDKEEKIIADISYKSRFIIDKALNDYLINDIIAKNVIEVDIVRGINNSEAILYTLEKSNKKNELLQRNSIYNKRLLHHDLIANRRRLVITEGLGLISISSEIVWNHHIMWMLPVLILLTVIIHIIFSLLILPRWYHKQLIGDIERMLREDTDDKKET